MHSLSAMIWKLSRMIHRINFVFIFLCCVHKMLSLCHMSVSGMWVNRCIYHMLSIFHQGTFRWEDTLVPGDILSERSPTCICFPRLLQPNHVTSSQTMWPPSKPCDLQSNHVTSSQTMWPPDKPCDLRPNHVTSSQTMWPSAKPCDLQPNHVTSSQTISPHDLIRKHNIVTLILCCSHENLTASEKIR